MINNQIVNLEKNIIDTINNSGLPVAISCLILDKIIKEAESTLKKTLEEEMAASNTADNN